MSKLLENKQIIHIATEIVALIAIVFYFSSKNKKLLDHIEDLSQRLEDQEDLIQKHEQIIRQLVQKVNNQGGVRHLPKPEKVKKVSKPNHKSSPTRDRPPIIKFKEDTENYNSNQQDLDDEYSNDDGSELDAEIADELEELEEQNEMV